MKFGLSYILLDGEELIEDNIINMKPHFDFISVILTSESLSGIKPSNRCLNILEKLKNENMINEIQKVKLKGNPGIFLRNCALNSLKNAKCNYGCVSDVDEFYEDKSIKKCKDIIINENVDILFTRIKQYYADENYAFGKDNKFVGTNCPFLFKITKNLKYGKKTMRFPYSDPKRYFINKLNFKLVDPKVCYMHHFWMVRCDIESKFKHRSYTLNRNRNYFNESYQNWKTWKPGNPGMGFGFKKHQLYKQDHTIKLKNFYKYAQRRT